MERTFANQFGMVDVGPMGRALLGGVSMLPGPLGFAGTAGKVGMNLNNVAGSNALIEAMGGGNLGFGQQLGGVLGLNAYGWGSPQESVQSFMRSQGRSVIDATGRPPNLPRGAVERGGDRDSNRGGFGDPERGVSRDLDRGFNSGGYGF